jgi:hypothetical protein
MVNVIVARDRLDCSKLEGQFVDESHFDVLVEEDTDCYMPPLCDMLTKANCGMKDCESCEAGSDEKRIAFKFRKNYFTKEECDEAYIGLHGAATQSFNRGLAAGPRGLEGDDSREWVTPYQTAVLSYFIEGGSSLNSFIGEGEVNVKSIRERYATLKHNEETRGSVWLPSEISKHYPDTENWFDRWADGLDNYSLEEKRTEALRVSKEWISTTNYAKPVFSGVAGWYDRYPRIPYGRPTAYTEHHPELFERAYPFLQSLNKGFKELLPWRWSNQRSVADKIDSKFLVPDTVFTTITVNKTFRTAAHYDAGDYQDGLSNLLVLGSGEYTGGYLVFPEYRIAVNVRPGDLLLVNNHEVLHGNTPIVLDHPKAERISVVCYFRENMLKLKSYKYENLRRQFVEERKNNQNHPSWHRLWNGISPDMWKSTEWRDFLDKHNAVDEDGVVNVGFKGFESFA